MSRCFLVLAVAAAAFSLTACEVSKSSTPLSPDVAGPIPGVQISAPKMLEPAPGTQIALAKQPITLLIENAGSNGPRPLHYSFDIATDTGFSNLVFSKANIAQGDGGRTSLTTDPLATGRTYYWRVRAQDGANTGPYATPAAFSVSTPFVIDVPGSTAPSPNSTVLQLRPSFTITDAPRSGPVGAISYLIELADSDSFANKVATWSAGETPSQTITPSPVSIFRVTYKLSIPLRKPCPSNTRRPANCAMASTTMTSGVPSSFAVQRNLPSIDSSSRAITEDAARKGIW